MKCGQRMPHDPRSIAWEEYLETWRAYSRRYGTDQDAERRADLG